jgi:hypothetical protein
MVGGVASEASGKGMDVQYQSRNPLVHFVKWIDVSRVTWTHERGVRGASTAGAVHTSNLGTLADR